MVPTSNPSAVSIIFRRKTEHIDWRYIASIDTNQLIQSSTEDELQSILIKQLLPQITYCSIETEINPSATSSLTSSVKLDPSFIKIFQLAQLVIEYLLYQQKNAIEVRSILETKHKELVTEHEKLYQQVQILKTALNDSRKELKRRKEMLTNTQNEILGAGNKDEYDQCPYCSKKFIAAIYLYSHIQRRHQGLPLQPIFNNNNSSITNGSLPNLSLPNQQQSSSIIAFKPTTAAAVIAVQEDSDLPKVQKINSSTSTTDLDEIAGRAKVTFQQAAATETTAGNSSAVNNNKISKTISIQTQTASIAPAAAAAANELVIIDSMTLEEECNKLEKTRSHLNNAGDMDIINDETEKYLMKLKQDMDNQWNQLTEKIQKAGIGELKNVFVTELNKIDDDVLPTTEQEILPEPKVQDEQQQENVHELRNITPLSVNDFEERFLKQEQDLENLRNTMQAKIEEDLVIFNEKLQAQEQFWRNKLQQVEEQYEKQTFTMQNEIQLINSQIIQEKKSMFTENSQGKWSQVQSQVQEPSTIDQVQTSQQQDQSSVVRNVEFEDRTPIFVAKGYDDVTVSKINVLRAPSPSDGTMPQSPRFIKPIPKPRRTSTPIQMVTSEISALETPSAVNNTNDNGQEALKGHNSHNINQYNSDYSSTDEEDMSLRSIDTDNSDGESTNRKRKLKRSNSNQEFDEKIIQMQRIRERVLLDVNRKMKELGIEADDDENEVEMVDIVGKDNKEEEDEDFIKPYNENMNMNKAFSELKRRMRSFEKDNQKYTPVRQRVQSEVNFAATSKLINDKLNETASIGYNHFLHRRSSLSLEAGSSIISKASSPLTKMLSAFKSTGANLKNKMVRSFKKKKKPSKKLSPKASASFKSTTPKKSSFKDNLKKIQIPSEPSTSLENNVFRNANPFLVKPSEAEEEEEDGELSEVTDDVLTTFRPTTKTIQADEDNDDAISITSKSTWKSTLNNSDNYLTKSTSKHSEDGQEEEEEDHGDNGSINPSEKSESTSKNSWNDSNSTDLDTIKKNKSKNSLNDNTTMLGPRRNSFNTTNTTKQQQQQRKATTSKSSLNNSWDSSED